ncbi:hypothetical protein C0431_15625 [bacterium]|nr:hypothetical protein [bacterium]
MPPVFRVQLVREKSGQRTGLDGPDAAAQILGRYLQHADRELFVSLMLNVKNQVIGIHTVSVGSLFAAIVSPREVFKAARGNDVLLQTVRFQVLREYNRQP